MTPVNQKMCLFFSSPNCWELSLRSTAKTRTFDKLRGHIFEQKWTKLVTQIISLCFALFYLGFCLLLWEIMRESNKCHFCLHVRYDSKGNCCKKCVPAHTLPYADGGVYVEMLSGWFLSKCKHTSEINFAALQQTRSKAGLGVRARSWASYFKQKLHLYRFRLGINAWNN